MKKKNPLDTRPVETTACQPLNYSSGFSHSGILLQIPLLISLTSARRERNHNQWEEESRVLPPRWECLEPGWSPDLRPPGPLWSTGFLHRQRGKKGSATSFTVLRVSVQVTMISQIITCVSLVVSDEALRQESHHERCNEGGRNTITDGFGRKQEELFRSCDFRRNTARLRVCSYLFCPLRCLQSQPFL